MPPLTVPDARAIAQALRVAADQGLAEPDVAGAVQALSGSDPNARAAADATLTAAAVRLARQQHGLIPNPLALDRGFALRGIYDPAGDFAAARRNGLIPAWAAALPPDSPRYVALIVARRRYAAIVVAGGWTATAAGPPPKLGAFDARVEGLRRRLGIEGYSAAASAQPGIFDQPLSTALAAFQTAHGLKPDGVMSNATVAALNVPAKARLAAIDANLERARWLPRPTPQRRIEVDTAAPEATFYDGGRPVLVTRVVAGRPTSRTPMFTSKVTAIIFNPPWVVPTGIAARELYPKERRSPGYLARNGFYVAGGQLIQRPGPTAALGYLKFDMPNPFSVYLHDTPSRSLFASEQRWLSHGCMRLQLPRELAAALLAPQGWPRASVDSAISSRKTRRVELTDPTPVFVAYWTVVTDGAGRAIFRRDVYGWDPKIVAAMAAPVL